MTPTTLADVRDRVVPGARIYFRRHPWHERRRGLHITGVVHAGRRSLVVRGHPVILATGEAKTWKEVTAVLYHDSAVEIIPVPPSVQEV